MGGLGGREERATLSTNMQDSRFGRRFFTDAPKG